MINIRLRFCATPCSLRVFAFQVRLLRDRLVVFVMCCRIAEQEHVNKMSVVNLASIFGPILMKLDSV